MRSDLLINKKFHHSITENRQYDALLKLAKAGISNEVRFSQAELYFAIGDYETAIFKWSQIEDELVGWSRKNIGDAYVAMEKISEAESVYLSLKTSDVELEMEKLKGLCNVYKQVNDTTKLMIIYRNMMKFDEVEDSIYQEALQFFESKAEYLDAFQAVITKNQFLDKDNIDKVLGYLREDRTGKIHIDDNVNDFLLKVHTYSIELFSTVFEEVASYSTSTLRTERLLQTIVTCIKHKSVIGETIVNQEMKTVLHLLDSLYFQLPSVDGLSKILGEVVPLLIDYSSREEISAVLNTYIGIQPISLIEEFYSIHHINKIASHLRQFMSNQHIEIFGYEHTALDISSDPNPFLIMVGGFNSGKSSFVNSILKEEVLSANILPTTSAVTIIRNGENVSLSEWSDGLLVSNSFEQLQHISTIHHEDSSSLSTSLIDLKVPNEQLKNLCLNFIDTPGFFDDVENTVSNPTFDYIHFADSVMVSFPAERPFSNKDKELTHEILNRSPEINLSFLLTQVDLLEEDELEETLTDVERKISRVLGENFLVKCHSSYEQGYYDEMYRYLKNLPQPKLKKRLSQFIPAFSTLISESKVTLERQVTTQLTILMEVRGLETEGSQYLNSLLLIHNDKKLNVSNSFQKVVLDGVFTEIRAKIMGTIHHIAQNIQYHLYLEEVIEHVNQSINQSIKNYFEAEVTILINNSINQWISKELNELISFWQRTIELTLENIDSKFKEDLLTLELTQNELEVNLLNLRKKNEYITFIPQNFVLYNAFAEKWLSNIGKFVGVQNNKDYLKIDRLKEKLVTDLFDEQIEQLLYPYKQNLEDFHNKFDGWVAKKLLEIEKIVEKNLLERTEIVQSVATELKSLKGQLPSKMAQWQVIEEKVRHLKLIKETNENKKSTEKFKT